MAIRNIRIYRSTIENVDFNSHPEGFYNQKLNCIATRICMKLRENDFSMGDFHHLYINLTTCKDEGTICLADRSIDKIHPWYRYYDIGISQETYDNLLNKDCIPTVIDLLEKTLKTQFATPEFDEARISKYVSEAVTQGSNMLMKYKEKVTQKGRAVLYLRYLDNFKFFPLLRVYDAADNVILEKDLPETTTFDNLGQISLSTKKVTIKPRKNSREAFYEPIEFEL
jgi:hypothetical protein